MGKITGFLEFEREDRDYEPVAERVKHWREFVLPLPEDEARKQAARCMDCGVPYCHGTSVITGAPTGCPVNNQIPDWNDLVYRHRWDEAARNLHSTNNFPEVTGRICPAPCEASCTLNIDENPVTIKTIECAIADRAIAQGLKPEKPARKTGKKVAVVGSGPAGLACAQQLARAGHEVHVYERWAKAGGLMRYGIPDFKMEKLHVDRRVEQMEAEGVNFHYGVHVGGNLPAEQLVKDYDAIALTGGAEKPRDLPIPGRELKGIHFAMDFLPQQNRRVSNEAPLGDVEPILATGKKVVVIGGGDTGSDCIGTSIRQGAISVTNFEIMPQPPEYENKPLTWPLWPLKLRTSSSHEEGAERDFAVLTQKFSGENGAVKKLHYVHVDGQFKPVAGTEFEIEADLVLLAMGFVHPVHEGMIKSLGLALDQRGNVQADTLKYQTSLAKVFAAGDMRRGQSLVVWAIREGRQCAHAIDKFLMGTTTLPR
ncbi:MAG TPA: glutamate synthase subunit beta [Pseudolabrys sp.]|nr:glutamate synthase subunit beta [Pseudolabrys sp.]